MTPKPGELLITTLPNRTGLFLAVQETETRSRTLARFSGDGEAASQRFVEALVAAGFRRRNEREEEDGVLRQEAGEAGEYSGGRQRHGGAEESGAAPERPGPAGAADERRPADA